MTQHSPRPRPLLGEAAVLLMALALGVLAVIGPAEVATAQSRVVEPTETQIDYYNRANKAYQAEDYDKAITLFELALDEGEINILYLNLGRALFKLGRCDEADAMYAKAIKAPTMVSPSAAEIKAKIDEYRRDMGRECPGTLVVKCEPSTLVLTIDDGDARLCDGAPITLPAGSYKIKGAMSGKPGVKPAVDVVTVSPMKTTTALLTVDASTAGPPPDPDPKPKASGSILPWITVGVGGTILATSLVLDATVVKSDVDDFKAAAARGDANATTLRDDAQSSQNLVIGGVILGSLVTAGGLVWVLLDRPSDASPPPSGLRMGDEPHAPVVQGWVGEESGGVQLELSW